ncbi:MAG: PKD domain-containing protein [Brumimicrobium sp.]|nr:PKD domain-containing protein [Brumimicrobium sp.]
MKAWKLLLIVGIISCWWGPKALAHSVQVGYCFNCNGDLRIWVEHWHGAEDPSTTTMTLSVTVAGNTTNHTGSPTSSVMNTPRQNLPGCTNPITIFASCPGQANTYNDWVAYDFPSMPANVPITITILSGNTVFTEDGCGMYPASTGVIIIPDPPSYPDVISCGGPGYTVPAVTAPVDNHWVNSNPGIGLPASGNGNIPAFTPPASNLTQTATITMSNSCGTTTFQIIIRPAPTAAFTAPGMNGSSICFDAQPVVVTDNSSATPGESIVSWAWDLGDGTTSSSGSGLTHSYASPGTYTVSLTVTSSNGCDNVLTGPIQISPMPVADFTTASVCSGTPVGVTDQSTINNVDGNVISSWNWDYGNGQTATGQTPSSNPSYPAEGAFNISLTVTSNNGCSNSVNHDVMIYPLPVVNFTPTTVCLNFPTNFTDLSTVSNAYTTNSNVQWDWDFDDGTTSTLQNPVHTYTSAGVYNTTLLVTSNNGCSNQATLAVTVYDLPVASFTQVNACDNEPIVMTSTATSPAGGFNAYYWDYDVNNVVDYTGNPASYVFPNDGFKTVRHIVEDLHGCRDTVEQQITVYALPHANFTSTSVCEDATTAFTNTSSINPVDNDNVTTYAWSFGNGNTSNQQNPTHAYGTENVYNAKLVITTNYGCKDSISHPVEVYPLPDVSFTPTDVCLNFVTQFQDQTTVSNAHTTNSKVAWAWDFADGTTSTLQNPTHTYGADGTYNSILTVTTNHGCVSSKTIVVTVHPLPVVSFVGQNLEGCAPVCPTITSTSTINSPSTLDQFIWTLSDGRTYTGSSFMDCYDNLTGNDITYGLNLKVISNMGCVSDYTANNYITVYHNPIADFFMTPEDPNVMDPEVFFHNTSLYADSYLWNIGYYAPTMDVNPTITFPFEPRKYPVELIAYTNMGCTDTIRGIVNISDRVIFYVPNTFTPDHDDFNEVFTPKFANGFDPQTYTLYIFNRWGELLFESHNVDKGWDGTYGVDSKKLVRDGTYLWKIEFKETMTDKHHTYTGHVNIIR